jgi:hypothetical protein
LLRPAAAAALAPSFALALREVALSLDDAACGGGG